VGEGGDEVSVARFIADQRTNYRVPHTITCALLGVSLSWFYKWLGRTPTPTEQRRSELDTAVAEAFKKARGLHGSPRLHADLREVGWAVAEKTVADSMRRQGLIARRIRRRNGLTRQDKTAPKFPDLLKRDFTASAPNSRWVGDMTEIPTAAGKLYLDICTLWHTSARDCSRPPSRLERWCAGRLRRRRRYGPGRRLLPDLR
jgi:putative transposase